MLADLHTHTCASDGELTPGELLQRANEQAVELLAITDHDTMDGYMQAAVGTAAPALIPGVEFSCVWGKILIHVVGLQVDPQQLDMAKGLAVQKQAREERGHLIGDKLAKLGFAGAYEGAKQLAGGGQVGRPDFARYLMQQGHVKSFDQAFKKYLGAGKPGDVKTLWPSLAEVVRWIVASGGTAVIAHPQRYKMTATKLRALIKDFKQAGGQAVEVISGKPDTQATQVMVKLCEQFELLASIGSDFHRPGTPWSELGCCGELPHSVKPVWSQWAAFN
jgi:predicted metal-dependent phosphoesterase TrpH